MKYLQNIETFYWDDTHKKSFICTGYWFQTTRLIISTLKVKPTLHFVISWHIELLTVTTSQTLRAAAAKRGFTSQNARGDWLQDQINITSIDTTFHFM